MECAKKFNHLFRRLNEKKIGSEKKQRKCREQLSTYIDTTNYPKCCSLNFEWGL